MSAATQPIRNKKHLQRLAGYFLKRKEYRNHLLLVIGSHTALRISDILSLTWKDVYNEEKAEFCTHISLTERKTGKTKLVALHPRVIAALRLYLPHRRGDALFASTHNCLVAISRVQAWRILSGAAAAIELGIRVSAHALRKTFGYHCWREGVPVTVLMEIYNHSSYEVTRRYLGVTQDDLDRAYLAVGLF